MKKQNGRMLTIVFTILAALLSALGVVVLFHRDDNFSSGVIFFQIPESLSRLT